MATEEQASQSTPRTLAIPTPTAWPMIMALGVTLSLAGIVTSTSVTFVGVILFVAGAIGWFGDVLPSEHREQIDVELEEAAPVVVHPRAAELRVGEEGNRASLPLQIYPYSAGIKGGIVGGVVMAVLAMLEGIIIHRSPWYTVNILAATINGPLAHADISYLAAFHLEPLVEALAIHAIVSVLMGLLYGVLLPMLPSHPIFFGGVIAPLIWTGLMSTSLGVLNPVLNQRIEWVGFVICQVGFGLTAGVVTSRSERMSTLQHLPFALRSGIEASGLRERGNRS
jgi:hypothetical protein